MNRKEAVIYLIENPDKEIKMIKNPSGEKIKNEGIVYVIQGHSIIQKNKQFISMCLKIDLDSDKTEFEVVRELRKMSFGEAYYFEKYCSGGCTGVRNVKTGELVNSNNIGKAEYSHGLWTIDGVYEE